MRSLTGGAEKAEIQGAATVRQVLERLEVMYPGFKERVVNQEGSLQPGVAISVGGELATLGILTPVKEDDEVHFIPAIGGG